jgi:hypothetical protein
LRELHRLLEDGLLLKDRLLLVDGNGNILVVRDIATNLNGAGNLLRNLNVDILRNISVLGNSEGNFTRSLNDAFNSVRLRNINISDKGDILLNNLRYRNLTLTLDGNVNVLRDLTRDLNRNLDLLGDGNVNISCDLNRVRNSDLNGDWNIDRHVDGDRHIDGNLDRSRSSGGDDFNWVRHINANFNSSGHGHANRDIDGDVNVDDSVNIVRDFDANFSGDGDIDRDVNWDRDIYRDANGHIDGNGNLDRDLNRDRASYLAGNLIRHWTVDKDSLGNILVDKVGLNDRNVTVLLSGNVLNLLKGDGVTADWDLNNLVLDERNVTRNDLFNWERLGDTNVIRNGNRDIVLERDANLLVYIPEGVLVNRAALLLLRKALLREALLGLEALLREALLRLEALLREALLRLEALLREALLRETLLREATRLGW